MSIKSKLTTHDSDTAFSASPMPPESSLRNHFLISMPSTDDSIFAHSVTYVCDHNEHGAMGMIINQPIGISLGDVFEQLDLKNNTAHGHRPVLAGGPVNAQQGLVLHRNQGQWESTLNITDEICLTASKDIIEAMSNHEGPQSAQLALGYAGWSPGQLEEELANNYWLTMPADSSIIFDTPLEQRWEAAAKQLGVDLDLVSRSAGHA